MTTPVQTPPAKLSAGLICELEVRFKVAVDGHAQSAFNLTDVKQCQLWRQSCIYTETRYTWLFITTVSYTVAKIKNKNEIWLPAVSHYRHQI